LRLSTFLISSFMHISMALLILIYYLRSKFFNFNLKLSSKFSDQYKNITINRISFFFLCNFGILILYSFTKSLNIRGTEFESTTSFIYSLMWIITSLITLYIFNKKYKPLLVEDYTLLLLTFSSPLLTIIGYEVLRFYAYAIPFAIISISRLGRNNSKLVLLIYLLNQSASTYYWLKLHFM